MWTLNSIEDSTQCVNNKQYWRFSSCYVAADASVLCAVGAILRSWTGKLGKKQSSPRCFSFYGYEMWNVIYNISVSIIVPLYWNSVFGTSLGYNQRSCKVSANQNLKCYSFTRDFWATALHTQRQHTFHIGVLFTQCSGGVMSRLRCWLLTLLCPTCCFQTVEL